jgi:hypothetical protein
VSEQRDPPRKQGEKAVDDMERRSERLGDEIAEARRDWEAKKSDESVPGAQSEGGDDESDREDPPEEADVDPGD